jgi:hypothetical protein
MATDDNIADDMEGVESTNVEAGNTPLMTEQEAKVLELYDRAEELQLEIALLKAQGVISSQGKS